MGWTWSDVHPLSGDDYFFQHVIMHIAKIMDLLHHCMRVEFKDKLGLDILSILATDTLNSITNVMSIDEFGPPPKKKSLG